jgi:predicted lipid-binding transport protein (Tim44 family)
MSEDRLFKQMDAQEQTYAPQQLPADQQERVAADNRANTPRDATDDHTPVAVPLPGGIAAAPASDEFDPGLDREERDLQRGDTSVVGPDPRDQAT